MYKLRIIHLLIALFCIVSSIHLSAQSDKANTSTEKEDVGRLEVEEIDLAENDKVSRANPEDFGTIGKGFLLEVDTNYKDGYRADAYIYTERKTTKTSNRKSSSAPNIPGGFIAILFKLLLVLMALAVLFFIFQIVKDLRIGYRSKTESKKENKVLSADKNLSAPEELDKTSLEFLLNQAVKNGDYTSATRYYFLIYLEKLQTQKEIVYHQDKTNADYLREIASQKRSDIFSQLSYLYEYIWYGKKDINAQMYEQISDTFKKALN